MRAGNDHLPNLRSLKCPVFEDSRDCQWYEVDLKITFLAGVAWVLQMRADNEYLSAYYSCRGSSFEDF